MEGVNSETGGVDGEGEGRGGRHGKDTEHCRELLQELSETHLPSLPLSSPLTLADRGAHSPIKPSAREEGLGRSDEPAGVADEERNQGTHWTPVEETVLQNGPGQPAPLLQENHWTASGVRVEMWRCEEVQV